MLQMNKVSKTLLFRMTIPIVSDGGTTVGSHVSSTRRTQQWIVDQVMQSQGGREALMKQVVLSNSVNTEIQTTFDKVAGKYQDVLKLEQSVAELHQLFMDFALLTEQQGELLDSIEYSVQAANEHIECANEETVKAIEYQTAIRKKQWYV